MTYELIARWAAPGTEYEVQQIHGEDGSVWLRVSQLNELVAVFSAPRKGPGIAPVSEVIEVLMEASTARRPMIIIDALRFFGWDFWPAVPEPLSSYLRGAFREQVGRVQPRPPISM